LKRLIIDLTFAYCSNEISAASLPSDEVIATQGTMPNLTNAGITNNRGIKKL